MTNRPKQKGTAAETAVVRYLRGAFPRAARRTLSGRFDRGDVEGIDGVVIEIKNVAKMALAEWVDEAVTEATNDGSPLGVVWHKRRGTTDPGQWYVTMTGEHFVGLLASKDLLEAAA